MRSVIAQHALHKTYDSNDGQIWISDHMIPGSYNGLYWLVVVREGKLNVNT
jgi:hypothetical protein